MQQPCRAHMDRVLTARFATSPVPDQPSSAGHYTNQSMHRGRGERVFIQRGSRVMAAGGDAGRHRRPSALKARAKLKSEASEKAGPQRPSGKDLGHHAGADRAAALPDCKPQAWLHGHGRKQLKGGGHVVTRHDHLRARRQRHRAWCGGRTGGGWGAGRVGGPQPGAAGWGRGDLKKSPPLEKQTCARRRPGACAWARRHAYGPARMPVGMRMGLHCRHCRHAHAPAGATCMCAAARAPVMSAVRKKNCGL